MTDIALILLGVAVVILAFRGDWHERRLRKLEKK